MRRRLDIIASDAGIEAVLGEPSADTPPDGKSWAGPLGALKAHGVGGRLIDPSRAVFDAELTARWGRLVACTREFSAWWRAHPEAPAPSADFFMEVAHE